MPPSDQRDAKHAPWHGSFPQPSGCQRVINLSSALPSGALLLGKAGPFWPVGPRGILQRLPRHDQAGQNQCRCSATHERTRNESVPIIDKYIDLTSRSAVTPIHSTSEYLLYKTLDTIVNSPSVIVTLEDFRDMGSSHSKFNLQCKLCIKTLKSVIRATEAYLYSRRHANAKIRFKFRACKSCLHCYNSCSEKLSQRKISIVPLPVHGESYEAVHSSCMLCPIRYELYFRNYYYFEGLPLWSYCSNCLLQLAEMVPFPQKRVPPNPIITSVS